ncbi:MAG TPA: ROK family protein [Opitutaceae bacterium]|nr:ROK family protein [Opitutaceae bacterium]
MSGMYAGVDLGGTKIACALADASGRILRTEAMPTQSHEGPAAVLARMAQLVADLAGGSPLEALGVGVPGLVDLETGTTLFLPNLPTQWRDVPVAATLSKRLGCPVLLLNDCRTATLGELHYGLGRGVRDMALFMLGTGIGGGIVIDRKLRLGPLGAAGEVGHQTILPDGPLCGCGNRGCLEALASGPAIAGEGVRLLRAGLAPVLHEIVHGNADLVNPASMARAARAGDQAVGRAIDRAASFLAIGVANIVTAFHPQLVVLGGGVAGLGDLMLDTVRSGVAERVRMFPAAGVAVELSALGDRAGSHGAVALALHGRDGARSP